MLTDIEIAQQAEIKPVVDVASQVGLTEDDLELYGKYKAKINQETLANLEDKENGRLILVTAISPTPAGEGKSTTSVGLADALSSLGHKTILALREPSLGPTMGIKGGAAGGGYAQVIPMEDINLHFTGDLHAITATNNALSALIDNHIQQGNELDIDVRRITWKRVVDLNDRALRNVIVGLGGPANGVPREDGFDITVASEIMAILCLSTSLENMRERFANIMIGQNTKREPVYVRDLGVEGALTLLMKDALSPNLVQTLEHTPAFVHGGPFANIAHGCNSVMATKAALKLADYTVTEAGFGADLGAEKFLDIKVPEINKAPDAVTIVATVRSLKMHGGVPVKELGDGENIEALKKGIVNLGKHIENIQKYNIPVVVAINAFTSDTDAEHQVIHDYCAEYGVPSITNTVWADGGKGGVELAKTLVDVIDANDQDFKPLYTAKGSTIEEKIRTVATEIYGAADVEFSTKAARQLKTFADQGLNDLAICIAKTQYSLSDDPTALGRPEGFTIHVRDLVAKTGAGFIVVLTGNVMTMPGLPKRPAALDMDVKEDGTVVGLF